MSIGPNSEIISNNCAVFFDMSPNLVCALNRWIIPTACEWRLLVFRPQRFRRAQVDYRRPFVVSQGESRINPLSCFAELRVSPILPA